MTSSSEGQVLYVLRMLEEEGEVGVLSENGLVGGRRVSDAERLTDGGSRWVGDGNQLSGLAESEEKTCMHHQASATHLTLSLSCHTNNTCRHCRRVVISCFLVCLLASLAAAAPPPPHAFLRYSKSLALVVQVRRKQQQSISTTSLRAGGRAGERVVEGEGEYLYHQVSGGGMVSSGWA